MAPGLGQRVESVEDGEAEKFLGDALDDLPSGAVVHRDEEIDDPERGQSAQQRRLLEKEDVAARASRRERGRRAGDAAADDDDVRRGQGRADRVLEAIRKAVG